MKRIWKSDTVATGLAIFSMFFGAGNVVFPLVIGRYAGNKNFYAAMGFLITAVLVPFLGLVAMVLFNGDYKKFFGRLGDIPGTFVIFLTMALIGPFYAIPRCIALSHTTIQSFLNVNSLMIFALLSCIIIYLLSIRRSKVVGILGRYLSPILLISLVIMIVKGFWSGSPAEVIYGRRRVFMLEGLIRGYNTMDIFAAFFFSSVVITGLKQRLTKAGITISQKALVAGTLRAGVIGLSLIGIIYTGFSYVSAFYRELLVGIPDDALISHVAFYTLGEYAGIFACLAVSLACLTTAIALSVVFAEFLRTQLFDNRFRYGTTLLFTMVIAFAFANIGFTRIVRMMLPILTVCYPPLIVLAMINIAHKVWGVKMVKLPVYTTFVLVFLYNMYHWLGWG